MIREKQSIYRLAVILLAWVLAGTGTANAWPTNADRPATMPPERTVPAADMPIPIDLGSFTITASTNSYELEMVLRFVREGFSTSVSTESENKDDWICWYDSPPKTYRKFVVCARNGDLWALLPNFDFKTDFTRKISYKKTLGTRPDAKYGRVIWSDKPIGWHALQKMLNSLRGSNAFNREFLSLAFAGERPPRDIPDDNEMDQYSRAYNQVRRLQNRGAEFSEIDAAISAKGLNSKRFERIGVVLGFYRSLRNEMAIKLVNNP